MTLTGGAGAKAGTNDPASTCDCGVELQRESVAVQVENCLMQLYHRLQVLRASMDEFDTVLKNQDNLTLLNKAL